MTIQISKAFRATDLPPGTMVHGSHPDLSGAPRLKRFERRYSVDGLSKTLDAYARAKGVHR
jgi:hypothetical protein